VASSLLYDEGVPTWRMTLSSKAVPVRDAGPAIGSARLYYPLVACPNVLAKELSI